MATLKTYVNTLIARAESFEEEWRKDSAKEPEQYPMEMGVEEWDEQFEAWLSLRDLESV